MLLQRAAKMLRFTILSAVISALSLLLIPVSNYLEGGWADGLGYTAAAVFWLGLLLEQVFLKQAGLCMQKMQSKKSRPQRRKKEPIGLVTFASSKEAKLMDLTLAISFVAVLVLLLIRSHSYWLVAVSLAIFLLSLNLHCILNGKTYRYIKKATHNHKKKKEPKRNGRTEN